MDNLEMLINIYNTYLDDAQVGGFPSMRRASIAYLPLVSKTLYFSMRKFPQNGQTKLYTLLCFPYSSSSLVILAF
jgi:hypothetical protein